MGSQLLIYFNSSRRRMSVRLLLTFPWNRLLHLRDLLIQFMQQTSNAPLQAPMQPNQLQCFMPVNTPAQAAKILRNEWDDTMLYTYKIGVLLLNDYLHPIGTEFTIPYNGELVSVRKLFRVAAAMNTAHAYVCINSPLNDFSNDLGVHKPNAEAMAFIGNTLCKLDISVMGYLIIDPMNHIFLDESELLNFNN